MSVDQKTACKRLAVDAAQRRHPAGRQMLSRKPAALLLVAAAATFGAGGLLAWLVFLLWGPPAVVDLGLDSAASLLLDVALCLLFFTQHSTMVRRWFRLWLTRRVHADFHGALYAGVSGICLLVLTGLWQPVGTALWSPAPPIQWFMRGICLAAVLAAWWGARSLGDFDSLGIRSAMGALQGKSTAASPPFTVRGPYRWVRHPLYLFSLIMIWSGPVFTIDRLLHNGLWTVWIVIGAALEERDLTACFGDGYRSYRQHVPMLLPRSVKPLVPRFKEPSRHDR